MLDFDKIFEQYAMDWYRNHKDEFEDAGEMEERMPELYAEWAQSPVEALGGLTPQGFFDNIKDETELIKLLVATSEGDSNPCSLLLDRIAECDACAPYLSALIKSDNNDKVKIISANLLTEMGADKPLDVYVGWLSEAGIEHTLRELAIETLCEHADEVKDKLYALLPSADTELKTVIAEILVSGGKDDRTYDLLCELFARGDNIPLYAGYIGKYGDERCSAMLYRALDTCNYMEYIEIKNAIERMGGVVDDVRDFSEDVYYKAIKNLG